MVEAVVVVLEIITRVGVTVITIPVGEATEVLGMTGKNRGRLEEAVSKICGVEVDFRIEIALKFYSLIDETSFGA